MCENPYNDASHGSKNLDDDATMVENMFNGLGNLGDDDKFEYENDMKLDDSTYGY